MKNNSSSKKTSYITRGTMILLTTILIILFFCIMLLVSQIQGTARIVNYAGLVRGKTQRIIKLEDAGQPHDEMIDSVSSYIKGLRYGSDKLNLVRLEDRAFQSKMQELNSYFKELCEEIQRVREVGYENTAIIDKSEHFFQICDEATGLAEAYSQRKATALSQLETIVFVDIGGLVILIALELIKALRYAAQNRILQSKVYLDEATGLPNKNKCEEILNAPDLLSAQDAVAICVFDLNNLRNINNNLGHDKGDEYIRSFAVQLRIAVADEYFVGRDGGDEFIAIIPQTSIDELTKIAVNVREAAAKYNDANAYLPISYAVGYALSTELEQPLMKNLLAEADKRMYINKQETKKLTAALEEDHSHHLNQMMNALEHGYNACYYCDYQNQTYRVMKNDGRLRLPAEGSYNDFLTAFLNYVGEEESFLADLRKMLSLEYVNKHIGSECSSYDIKFLDAANTYWLAHVMLVDIDRLGRLSHFILTFTDITHTRNMEYAATHDALTDLLNRYAGFMYIEQALAQKDADSYALMIIDIDNFKAINDTFGHSMGDTVIKELANAMRNFFSKEAILIRYGGDEFLILAKVAQDEQALHSFMQRLVASMSEDVAKRYPEVLLTISAGVAPVQHGLALQTLFNRADDALYHAKRKGKNTYNIYQAEEKS